MARDFAKGRQAGAKTPATRKKTQPRRGGSVRGAPDSRPGSAVRSYFSGLLSGIFLCFLAYLYMLPPADAPAPGPETAPVASVPAEPPKPRFDFYTMLPQQTLEDAVEPAGVASPPAGAPAESYLLQAGSFRQREDADRRRAELLLLGLQPNVEESDSDTGHWFRVYLGPYNSHTEMAQAKSLMAAQDIDSLLLKHTAP
jgi:cell division septation protein DedD